MLPKTELLKGIENLDRISRILDQTDQAIKTWEVVFTDFLSPPELAEAQTVLAKLTEVSSIAWGGYPQVERQRLAICTYQIVLTADN